MEARASILILGGGLMQMPAIQEAKNLGYQAVVTDVNPSVPGASAADVFLPEDLRSPDAILSAVDRKGLRSSVRAVFTAGTDFSHSVALLAAALGLPGISPDSALKASDKSLMRKTLSEAGIPGPHFIALNKDSFPSRQVDAFLGEYGYPLVLKPVDNMGSRGVRTIRSDVELQDALKTAFSFSPKGRCILEEFIPGSEYSIDTLFWKGRMICSGIAQRHIHFPPYFVELGHSFPSGLSEDQEAQIASVMTEAAAAVGIENGPVKGDIFWGPEGPVVGEIAARLSGGYMSGWTFPYAKGVNLTRAALLIALGQEPKSLTTEASGMACAERALVSFPGTVTDIEGTEALDVRDGFRNWFPRVELGQKMVFPRNNVEKAGNVVFVHGDLSTAAKAAEDALSIILLRLDPRDETTRTLLANPDADIVPDAYPLQLSRKDLDFHNPRAWDARPWLYAREELLKQTRNHSPQEIAAAERVLRRYGLQAALAAADSMSTSSESKRWVTLIESTYPVV